MTEVTYRVKIGIDIHGNFFIMKCITSKITQDKVDMFTKICRASNPMYRENYVEPLIDCLGQHDLYTIDDDYRTFKDVTGDPLVPGKIYHCDMVFTYTSSFNGESTEYDSDYKFMNFTLIKR
jgi:hypothetical protein